jgi:hypothetical protein
MSVPLGGDTDLGETQAFGNGRTPASSAATPARQDGEPGGQPTSSRAYSNLRRPPASSLRVAFLGRAALLENWAPTGMQQSFRSERFAIDAGTCDQALRELEAFQGDVVVVFDPAALEAETLDGLLGITLGVLPEIPDREREAGCAKLDRLVCFDPALTGEQVGRQRIWRAVPPPVSDELFREGHALHRSPRTMALGASSSHREAMLMPAKHHHDVLQAIHGLRGEALLALLDEYDVGIHVSLRPGGGFDWSAGLHLAAGQLLLSEPLMPAHGLEANIDYVRFESAEDLVLTLDRLAVFPEMYRRIQIRGHLKSETFRASRIFGRIASDLILDVAAFGRD